MIRDGNLVEGREQLEIAVALDPTNSLLRSYVGKAYYEEKTKERDALAARSSILPSSSMQWIRHRGYMTRFTSKPQSTSRAVMTSSGRSS